jgi:hypothetical protein
MPELRQNGVLARRVVRPKHRIVPSPLDLYQPLTMITGVIRDQEVAEMRSEAAEGLVCHAGKAGGHLRAGVDGAGGGRRTP